MPQSLSERFGEEKYLLPVIGIELRLLGYPANSLVTKRTTQSGSSYRAYQFLFLNSSTYGKSILDTNVFNLSK